MLILNICSACKILLERGKSLFVRKTYTGSKILLFGIGYILKSDLEVLQKLFSAVFDDVNGKCVVIYPRDVSAAVGDGGVVIGF